MEIAEKLREFIKENFYADTSDLTNDASLLDWASSTRPEFWSS